MATLFDGNAFNPTARYRRLSEDQAHKIHNASLEILERIGVRLHLPEAVRMLERAGASAGSDGLVRLRPEMVERALATAPRRVVLYDRNGNPVMPLEGDRCFFGPGSDCLNIIDHRTGLRRKPILRDVAEGTRLCDALPNIDFVMSMVLPEDVDQTLADTLQMEAMLSNTTKPIILVSYEVDGLVNAVEMAEVVAGGEAALCEKPNLTCYINVISGAVHNAAGLQKLLYLARKGLPALYIPGSNAGVTSPATLPGAIALDNAGLLVGLVLSQLAREGAPFIWSAMDGISLDMRTLISPYDYPERGIMRSMAVYYGLPSFALSGGSDAKIVDQQAAAEAALTLLADVFMGGNIIHDLGYLESGLTFSFSQLAICDQIVDWIKAFFRPVEVTDETLALDVIERVGPGGQYLSDEHTLQRYRDHWYPHLFERDIYPGWVHKGEKNLDERAAARVEKILAEHTPEPLPEEVLDRLKQVVHRAEAHRFSPATS